MILKRFAVTIALLTLVVSPFVFGSVASASHDTKSEAAEICRQMDEAGELEQLGVTRGECVNVVAGPSNENANNTLAGLCGTDLFQRFTRTTNKGQCIQVLSELP